MRVEIDTSCKKVTVTANESAITLATVDKWIKALRVAREWLRKELEQKK